MRVRMALGAVFTVLAIAAGSAVNALPAAAAETELGPDKALLTPEELRNIDIIGACNQLGAGVLYLRALCSNSKKSMCSTRFSPVEAAGEVATREEVRLNVKVTTLPYSVNADNINSAAFRSCADGAPVVMDKIEVRNNFTVSGVKLDSCDVGGEIGGEGGAEGPVPSGKGTGKGTLTCTIKADEKTFGDDQPVSCTNCSELNSDVYQWYARWSLGFPTRYMHESRAIFTGKTSKLQISTVVDIGI